MKIVKLHKDFDCKTLISKLIQKERKAQKECYDRFSPKMLSVCRSYISDTMHAEDAMIKGFFKVFTQIENFRGEGNFVNWIRKIMIKECLNFLRNERKLIYLDDNQYVEETENFSSDLLEIDAQSLLDALPDTHRTVFNLFVLENYSHREISEMLNISENTSKSHLYRAKEKLKKLILSKNEKSQ